MLRAYSVLGTAVFVLVAYSYDRNGVSRGQQNRLGKHYEKRRQGHMVFIGHGQATWGYVDLMVVSWYH